MKIRSKLITTASLTLGFLLGLIITNSLPAMAATYPYNPSNLITDDVFTNTSSMSASAIQTFLVNENSGLKNLSFTESCSPTTPVQPYGFTYYPNCGKTESAATIIYDAGMAYGINPQVLLATMQKEQSLVTTPDPTNSQLNCAMGYLSCSSDTGFFSQVDNASWQFRDDIELMQGNSWWGESPSSYICKNSTTLYNAGLLPGATVTFADPAQYNNGTLVHAATPETITLANAATAALYCYTPYVGPYSLTGYSGSYNFVESFEEWFGSTQGTDIVPQQDAVYRLYSGQTGDHFLTASASEADTYAEAGWHYDGVVAHSDSGGTVPVYRLYNGLTQQHYYTTSSTTVSQYEAKGWHSDGIIFYGDSSGAPVWRLSAGNSYFVTASTSELATYLRAGWQNDGILYYQQTNDVDPVWRLYGSTPDDHFLTTSPSELATYLAAGWHNDGIVMQGDPNGGTSVYRLYNGKTHTHYYTSNTNELDAYLAAGWHNDGEIFTADSSSGTPVYRLSSNNSYFVTASTSELNAYLAAGWHNDGVIFYTPNIVAGRRLYQPSTGSHMTIANIGTLWQNAQYGWDDDGIQFYISTSYGTPIYQLYSTSNNSYFYTASSTERSTYINAGWVDKGVAFYAPPGGTQPVYRLYNSTNGTHILVATSQELTDYTNAGWHNDGVIFDALASP